MKKFLPVVALIALSFLSGCAAIQKQANINKQMESLVFNVLADKLYNTAVGVMNSKFISISKNGMNEGASFWNTNNRRVGSKVHREKVRFTVKVMDVGKNKSRLNISRETVSNFTGRWGRTTKSRYFSYEYSVLQKLNPQRAAQIDKIAAVK